MEKNNEVEERDKQSEVLNQQQLMWIKSSIFLTIDGQFQFHMNGVKIQIIEKRLHGKLYPVLHCEQVKVHRKIYFCSLATTVYSGGGGGFPK